ncbi:BPTI/Kunitz domain-containing protein-like [Pollicipes pollicipes]|uniref:BPTI/Kunitz domain-containing protein-like n=1 Tax=Pollicipes pollicipes TaxID=41117 RepID=UPI0018850F4B|nr:BPTI/Kunitz domain-containing protein-like [Pollicipes pollicipes]
MWTWALLLCGLSAAEAAVCGGPCQEPLKVGPCKALVDRYYFSSTVGTCLPFFWGGCQANGNNFETISQCSAQCCGGGCGRPSFCSLPADVGPCLAIIPSYYFDGKSCRKFDYGGCGGNKNRFDNIEQCKKVCRSHR